MDQSDSSSTQWPFGLRRFHPHHVRTGDPARDRWLMHLLTEHACPRCAEPGVWDEAENWSQVTTDRCIPICGPCAFEEEWELLSQEFSIRPLATWPMAEKFIAIRDVLVQEYLDSIEVIHNPTQEDIDRIFASRDVEVESDDTSTTGGDG